jgi:hypothetical protein
VTLGGDTSRAEACGRDLGLDGLLSGEVGSAGSGRNAAGSGDLRTSLCPGSRTVAIGTTRVAGEGIRVAGAVIRGAGRNAGLLLADDDLRASGWSSDRFRPGCPAATQTLASSGKMARAIAPKTAARTMAALRGWKFEAFVALSPV